MSVFATGKVPTQRIFFFVYATFFEQLHIRVPFTKFQMGVLRPLNVAPLQLHPNSWAAIQAFVVMRLAAGVIPTIPSFLYYFDVRPPPKGGWVSLTSVMDRTLFKPYVESYKNFKDQFFKVVITAAGRQDFFDEEGSPLFPLYWTENPTTMKAYSKYDLDIADLCVVDVIDTLPRRLPARNLVDCLPYEKCSRRALGMVSVQFVFDFYRIDLTEFVAFFSDIMAAPNPRQSNFLISKRGSSSTPMAKGGVVPPPKRPPPPARVTIVVVRPPPSEAVLEGVPLKEKTSLRGSSHAPAGEGSSQPLIILVASTTLPTKSISQSAPVGVSIPSRKRRRYRKEGDTSSSRKSRREDSDPPVILPGGVFSTDYNVSRRVDLNMGPAQRAIVESIPSPDMLDAIFEMSSRTASMVGFLRQFGDVRGDEG